MSVQWQRHLYSYAGKYGGTVWQTTVAEQEQTLLVTCTQRLLTERKDANGRIGHYFSGKFEKNTLTLSRQNGALIEQNKQIIEKPADAKVLPDKAADMSPDKKHYFFGSYHIFMESNWTLQCEDRNTGQTIWKQNLRHWLYTDIECKDDILYFCTQGNGGLLYALSLKTGDTIFSHPNSCPNYFWLDNTILFADPKVTWFLAKAKTGAIIKPVFNGQILKRMENIFVVLTSEYNRSSKQYDAILSYVKL